MVFNTGESPEELKEKYNSEGSLLRDCQLRMLDMLIYLDGVCKKLNIPYVLDGGNLLGAIRHGGFIPWDDDVDIAVPRKYYKQLCEYLEQNPHPQFVLQSHKTDSNYMIPWNVLRDTKSEYIQDNNVHNLLKNRGLQVDLFPLDEGMNRTIHIVSYYIQNLFVIRFLNRGFIKIASFFYFFIYNLLFPLLLILCKCFGDSNKLMYAIGTRWPVIHNKKYFKTLSSVEFENHIFSCVGEPKEYLKELYGDYMSLPPIEKRDHHKANYKIWN